MSDGSIPSKTAHSRSHHRSPQGQCHRSAASRRLNDVFTSFRDDPALRDCHHHRRRRSILLARLGSEGGRGRREIRRGLGRRRLRRTQLSAQSQQAHHRRGQRHRLRRRLRDRARHRHHRDGGAREVCPARDQRRRAGRCRHHQAAPAHSLSRGGGVPDDRTLDGRRRSQALGARQPRGAQGRGAWPRRARSRGSWPTGRRCCFRPSSSCCATPRWCPSMRPSKLHDSLDAVQRVIRSEDLKEGTRAFAEKRKPRWTGRWGRLRRRRIAGGAQDISSAPGSARRCPLQSNASRPRYLTHPAC
jgi:hypothetical protein